MKKKLYYCLAILVFAAAMISCSEDVAESIKGSIVGTVSDDTTGELIDVAQVSLIPSDKSTVKSTVTGSDGRFTFNELEAGEYTIDISKTSYKPCSTKIIVSNGKQTDAHILMERIPAIITTDKELLEFGENNSVTSLSFNIVNKSYKALEWSVDCTSLWVTSIEPKTSGKLDYGKTATLIVKIDRNKLESGYNESYLVVFSEEGSVEVKLTAIGAETAPPTLNIIEATNFTSTSVRLNAKITNPGTPAYFKRGFVYGISNNPTIEVDEDLPAPVDGKDDFFATAENLNLGTTYYARAYAINKIKGEAVVTYSANSIQFGPKSSSPKVSIAEVTDKDVDKKTAILNGVIDEKGDPIYSEKGFVYGTTDNPTIENNLKKLIVEGATEGEFSALATGLKLDATYYVRAYAINEAGIVYSEALPFKLESSLPEVAIEEVTETDIEKKTAVLKGFINKKGAPAYSEKGFVYGTSNYPTIENNVKKLIVEGATEGEFSALATSLELNATYYVRAYAINEAGIVYSKEEKPFKLGVILPEVVMSEDDVVTDVVGLTATFNATINKMGSPTYTSRGFVYANSKNPTIESGATQLPVSGVTAGGYSVIAHNLQRDVDYHVRAYVISEAGTVYSKDIPFELKVIDPAVSIEGYDEVNIQHKSAKLKGQVICVGDPAYTEKGFVYSDTPLPTIYDKKIAVEGIGEGEFSAPINNLDLDKVYYVRAYINNENIGVTHYSEKQIELELTTVPPSLEMISIDDVSYSGKRAKFTGKISASGDPAYEKKGFVYGFNSNPTFENDSHKIIDGEGVGEFSINVANLIAGEKYFVRAFAEQNGKCFYSNELSFTLQPVSAEVGALTVSDISTNTSKLQAQIYNVGDPVYTEKGFVYNLEGNPDLYNRIEKVLANGDSAGPFDARISNLQSNTTYYARAYVVQNNNIYYSKEEAFTTAKVPAKVNTNPASDIMYTTATLNASVTAVGDPSYTHRGFYYGTNSNPTASNSTTFIESETSLGNYSKKLTGLNEKTTYYYRAFVVQPGDTSPILGSVQSFKTGHAPNVTTGGVINVTCTGTDENNLVWSATLYGGLDDQGDPAYTEFGFVYGTATNPTVDDGKSTYTTTTTYDISGSAKVFHKTVSGFATDTDYYVRAVAKTPLGYVYGEPIVFTPTVIAPAVRTYSTQCEYVEDVGWAVALVGVTNKLGQPAATGLGFVYGLTNEPTVGDGTSTAVSYTKIETQGDYYIFGAAATGLTGNKEYYVRAYAKTSLGYTYGETLMFWTY